MSDQPTDQPLGRDEPEYADDARCKKCGKWFRRHALLPIPKEEYQHLEFGQVIPWGLCPNDQERVYPS